jgi:hypothetical protein
MTPAERQAHAEELAAKLSAAIHVTGYRSPMLASGVQGEVWPGALARVKIQSEGWCQLTYFSALHELGHVACGHLNGGGISSRYHSNPVEAEAEAWLWAVETAAEPIRPKTRRWVLSDEAFGSYCERRDAELQGELTETLRTRLGTHDEKWEHVSPAYEDGDTDTGTVEDYDDWLDPDDLDLTAAGWLHAPTTTARKEHDA